MLNSLGTEEETKADMFEVETGNRRLKYALFFQFPHLCVNIVTYKKKNCKKYFLIDTIINFRYNYVRFAHVRLRLNVHFVHQRLPVHEVYP